MSIDSEHAIEKGALLERGVSPLEKEQGRLQKVMNRAVCLAELRSGYEGYPIETIRLITADARVSGLKEAGEDLGSVGIDLSYADKLPGNLGFLTDNLASAAVMPHRKEHTDVLRSGIVVAGICFPAKLTLQSILPLLVVKELFDTKRAFTAYFAMPLGAYAAAGLGREDQYRQVVSLMQHLFGDKVGRQVFIIPDTREELLPAQELVRRFGARNVSDTLATKKYPFHNLFRYTETAGYGGDIVLPLLAEGAGVTIIADYRQFESIHAGIKMAEAIMPEKDVRALLYTLVNPVKQHGGIREVSQDDGIVPDENKTTIAETSALFYEALLLFPESTVREVYAAFRDGSIDFTYLEQQIEQAKNELFQHAYPASKDYIRQLENISIERLRRALPILRELQEERLSGGLYARR